MHISSYLEGLIADWLRGSNFPAAPSSLELALSDGDPTDDGSGLDEPEDIDYERAALVLAAPSTTEFDGTRTTNSAPVAFTGTDLGTLSHGAIFDDADNMLMYGPLDVTRVIVDDDSISFATNIIRVTLAGRFGKYLAEAIINWMRGTTMPTAPSSLKLALSRANPQRDGSGLNEASSGQNYNRQTLAFGSPISQVGVGTIITNTAPLVFGPAEISGWSTLTHWALMTPTGNNLLSYGAIAVPKEISVGEGFGMHTGTFTLIVR